jgi:hypothetical protein
MDDLAASLKKLYIEKLTKAFSLEKLLTFFIFILSVFYLSSAPSDGSFVKHIQSIKFEELLNKDSGPLSELTIGDIVFAVFLTFLNSLAYKWLKRTSFSYLSRKRGFESVIRKWIDKTQNLAIEGVRYDTEYMTILRKRIDEKVSHVIFLHSWGEVLLGITSIVLVSLKTFNRNDFVFCLVLAVMMLWLQRHVYIYYLVNVLPEMVSELTFLGESFTHQKFFDREVSKKNSMA